LIGILPAFGEKSVFIKPATIQIAFRASGMARIKASLAGKGGSQGISENA